MLLRVEAVVGGSNAAGPILVKGPPLHACLATASIHDSDGSSPHHTGEILTIGRSDCTVTFDDKCVSQKHASIRLLSNRKIVDGGTPSLQYGVLMNFGSPSTPEEVLACETSPSGIVCVIEDTSKFGTFVSIGAEAVIATAGPREGESGGDESDTDDEGASATLRSYIELSERQRLALGVLEKDEDSSMEEATKFEKIERSKPFPLLPLSHSNSAQPQVTILLGLHGSAIRLSLVPLHFTFERHEETNAGLLRYVGASLSAHLDVHHSTHLIVPSIMSSVQCITAVLSGKPIVTMEYVNALLQRKSPEDALPSEENYCPPGSFDSELNDVRERRTLLRGYCIGVTAEDVAQLAMSAGAEVILIPESAPASQGELEEWWQRETDNARAAKLVVVVVVDRNDKSCERYRECFENVETHLTSLEKLVSSITGSSRDEVLLLDLEDKVIEKIVGWEDLEEGFDGQDETVHDHAALDESFRSIGYFASVIQGHVAKLHDDLLGSEQDSDASMRGNDIVSGIDLLLSELENLVPHLDQEALAVLKGEYEREADAYLTDWALESDPQRPKAETNEELGQNLMLLAYNAHVIRGHFVKMQERLLKKGVEDDEISARSKEIYLLCVTGIIEQLGNCAPYITDETVPEISREANAYLQEWADSNPSVQRDDPLPVIGKRNDAPSNAEVGGSDSGEEIPQPTKKKRGKPKKQQNKNRTMKPDPKGQQDTAVPFDIESFFNEQREALREIAKNFDRVGKGELVAGDTLLLRAVHHQYESVFDSSDPKLRRIPDIAKNLVVILDPLSKAKQMLVQHLQKDSICFTAAKTSVAAILLRLEELDEDASNEPNEASAYLDKVKAAIARHRNKSTKNVGISEVKDFVQLGYRTRNLITHALNIHVINEVRSTLTVYQLFGNFSKKAKSEGYIDRAKELSLSVNPEFDFNESTTVFAYMEAIIRPGLYMADQHQAAKDMVCDFKENLTQTQGKARRDVILPIYKGAQSKTVLGEEGEDGEDFFAGTDVAHADRRRRGVNLFFDLWLHDQLQQQLPDDLFLKHSFIRSILCNSISAIERHCNFATRAYFKKSHRKSSGIVKGLEDNILNIDDDDDEDEGRRTVLIENKEQLNSYKQLLE